MNNFLGNKTQEQIKMIKALVMLKDEQLKSFSAKKISEQCEIPSRDFGGAFRSLANSTAGFPPLILKAGRERIDTTDNKRRYNQLWRINLDFDWPNLVEVLKNF